MDLFLISSEGLPIYDQLKYEEALLRTEGRNVCFINTGSPKAIVMGASGKAERLIDLPRTRRDQIPIIKRFSGGGTVFIDENTLFVTFIFNKCDMPISPFPRAIMNWSKDLYEGVFSQNDFNLNENDYVFGGKKFGGNAQYIQKERWLHHTSFLWDFDPQKMNYLKMPEKTPVYREGRSHGEFLCALRPFYPDKGALIQRLLDRLKELFNIKELPLSSLMPLLDREHRRTTERIH